MVIIARVQMQLTHVRKMIEALQRQCSLHSHIYIPNTVTSFVAAWVLTIERIYAILDCLMHTTTLLKERVDIQVHQKLVDDLVKQALVDFAEVDKYYHDRMCCVCYDVTICVNTGLDWDERIDLECKHFVCVDCCCQMAKSDACVCCPMCRHVTFLPNLSTFIDKARRRIRVIRAAITTQ